MQKRERNVSFSNYFAKYDLYKCQHCAICICFLALFPSGLNIKEKIGILRIGACLS